MTYVLKQYGQKDDETEAKSAFRVGMYLYGYCCGFFGRDSYFKKKIVAITDSHIKVVENGVYIVCDTSRKVFSWVELLESSNRDCDAEEWDDDPENWEKNK